MSSASFATFVSSFARVRGLLHVGRALEGQALAGVDITESFRAAIVLSVSALDSYVHNISVEAIVDSYLGNRKKNAYYNEARVRLSVAEVGITGNSANWLESELSAQFGRETYQRPDDIAKALRFVDDHPKKWHRISALLGETSEFTKMRLNSIVDRRNMIVHEADFDPVWGIARVMRADESEAAINFVFSLTKAIDNACW